MKASFDSLFGQQPEQPVQLSFMMSQHCLAQFCRQTSKHQTWASYIYDLAKHQLNSNQTANLHWNRILRQLVCQTESH